MKILQKGDFRASFSKEYGSSVFRKIGLSEFFVYTCVRGAARA